VPVTIAAVAFLPLSTRRLALASAGVLAASLLVGSGSAAYSLETASVAHSGSIPSAGPSGSALGGPGGASMGGGAGGRRDAVSSALAALLEKTDTQWAAATVGAQGSGEQGSARAELVVPRDAAGECLDKSMAMSEVCST